MIGSGDIMTAPIRIRHDIVIPADELWETASRSGGPGGQYVNTTSSRVTLHWRVAETTAMSIAQKERVLARLKHRITADGVLKVSVDEERSRHANQQIARARLKEIILKALIIPKNRIPTKVPQKVMRQRLYQKTRRGHLKRLRGRPDQDE